MNQKRKNCASILAYGKRGFKASLPQGRDEIVLTTGSSQPGRILHLPPFKSVG